MHPDDSTAYPIPKEGTVEGAWHGLDDSSSSRIRIYQTGGAERRTLNFKRFPTASLDFWLPERDSYITIYGLRAKMLT